MKPVILVTVHSKLYELAECLDHLHSLKHEFKEEPEIVLHVADKKIGHTWFFDNLIRNKKINHLISRDRVLEDGGPTSIPESRNIRAGLNFIEKTYRGQSIYVIVQCYDIFCRPGTYKLIDEQIHNGEPAVLFFWANKVAKANCWHTNLLAITMDRRYWIPEMPSWEFDTLEVFYGKYLADAKLPFFASHNSRSLKFEERQYDDVPLELKGVPISSSVTMFVMGYSSILTRVKNWFKKFFWR